MDCIFNATFFPTSYFVRKLKRPKKKKKKAREALWMWMLSPARGVWWWGDIMSPPVSGVSNLNTPNLQAECTSLRKKKQYIQNPEDFL